MKRKWTRRRFVGTAWTAPGLVQIALDAAPATVLRQNERENLRAAMDEIIPAGEGMPAASAAGGLEYLDRLAASNPDVKDRLRKIVSAIDAVSRKRFRKNFASLPSSDRAAALQDLEERPPPELFADLRDLVYESYYTQPQVWKRIGYEPHLTGDAGPHMKPFDEAALAEVRRKAKFYREVD
jgi:hypothetical protein